MVSIFNVFVVTQTPLEPVTYQLKCEHFLCYTPTPMSFFQGYVYLVTALFSILLIYLADVNLFDE